MKKLAIPLILAAGFCQGQQPPVEAPPPAFTILTETGAQVRSVNGEKTFGLERHAAIPNGFVLRRFDFEALKQASPLRFTFHSLDLGQRDQLFHARLENVGKMKIDFSFAGFQRYWSNRNPLVLTAVESGVYVAPAGLRGALEGASEAALAGIAADAIANAPQLEVRSTRQRGVISGSYNLTGALALGFSFMRERRGGNRLISMGTYNRIGTPLGDRFETPGQELREPTSYGTTEFSAELRYTKKKWSAGVEYRGSNFNNRNSALLWQNPFRLTHAQATLPAGALLRGRFAASQVALPPDNQAHTFTGSVMVLLPGSTRLSGVLSYGRWTQNEQFLPITINEAITAPVGTVPTSLSTLPKQSLEGLIHTFTQDYAATTRPLRPVQLTLRYNDYDLKNDTHEILFPAYAGFGDSFWRTSITGQPGTANVPIRSEPKSFHRRRAHFEGALRPSHDLTWKSAYRWDRWIRDLRQADLVTEHGFLTSVAYAPSTVFFAQAGFRYFDRKPDAYHSGTLEPAFLRMFDQAQRQRKQGDALISVNLKPQVSLSAAWFYVGDTYDKSFFGLHQQKTSSSSIDLTWNARDSFGMFLGWGYDRTGYDYLTVTKTGTPYNFANMWSRDTRDAVHSANFGFSGSCAKGKVNYQASYAAALARMIINTTNPNTIVPGEALNAQAYPFPNVKNQMHEVRLDTSYEVGSKVRIGLAFLMQPYRLNDFANDTISPYAPGNIAPENDARRFYFTDSGPSNYLGNVVAVYLRYSFF